MRMKVGGAFVMIAFLMMCEAMRRNVYAMSSGGFGITHFEISNNDRRNHKASN